MEKKYDIEEWASTRDFEELGEKEKTTVIEALGSEEAYTDMRKIILSFQSQDQDLMPNDLHQSIMDSFDLHHRKSRGKIIPIIKSGSGAKNILVYAMLAASIIVGVFLLLPWKNTKSDNQLADNSSKKEISMDSVLPQQNTERDSQETNAEDLVEKEFIKTQSESRELKDINNLEKYPEIVFDQTNNKSAEKFSQNSDQSDSASNKMTGNISSFLDDKDEEIVEITAPPRPVEDRLLNEDKNDSYAVRQSVEAESIQRKRENSNDLFKVEMFELNHYTSY